MLGKVKLSNSSLAPAKLREHFTKVHGTGKYKDTTLTQFKQKRTRFDAMLPLHFVVLFQWINGFSRRRMKWHTLIAKHGKPHIMVVVVVLPDPFLGMGARINSAESQ